MPLHITQAQFLMIMKRYSLTPSLMERVFGFTAELLEAEAEALDGAAYTDDRFCSLMSAAREVTNLSDSYFDLLRHPVNA